MATMTDPKAPTQATAARRRPLIFYGYWILGAAFVAQFVSVAVQAQVSGVFLGPMTEDLGWARAEYASTQTIGRFIMAFAGFFIGVYVDRFGGRRLMLIGVTIVALSLMAVSQVQAYWQWVVLHGVIFTFGVALMSNLVVNVTLSKWFVRKRGRVIGFSSMGVSFAGIVIPPLMTIAVDEFGWRAGWRILAVGAVLLIYPVALVMRRQPEDHGLHPDGMSDEEVRTGGAHAAAVQADYDNSFTRREALHTSTFYIVVLSFGLGTIGIGVMLFGSIPFLTDEGFSRGTAALMMSVLSFPAFITKPIWGWLMDYVQPKRLASVGFAICAVAMVLILFSAKAHSLPLAAASFFLLGAGFGGQIPLQEVVWASYFGRRYLGAVRSVALPISLLLGANGPLVVQIYYDRVGNYDNAFLAIAGCWALAAGLILFVRQPRRPRRMDEPPPSSSGPGTEAAAPRPGAPVAPVGAVEAGDAGANAIGGPR